MQHFLPIAVIHVVIQDLGAVGQGGGPCRCGDGVQYGPQGLQNFTVDNSGARHIICCPSVKAIVLVAMNMEKADSMNEIDMVCDGKLVELQRVDAEADVDRAVAWPRSENNLQVGPSILKT